MFSWFLAPICFLTQHFFKTIKNQIYRIKFENKSVICDISFHYCPLCHKSYINCKDSTYSQLVLEEEYEELRLIIDNWLKQNTNDISDLSEDLSNFFTIKNINFVENI